MEELFVGVVELKGSYNDLGLTQSEEIKSSMLFEQLNLLQTLSTTLIQQRLKKY